MRRFFFWVLLLAMSGACTPPRVYQEGYEPPPARGGIAYKGEEAGTWQGGAGPASGAAGIAFFATQNQLYEALGSLLGGPLAQGEQTWRGLEVTRMPHTLAESRAIELLQTLAERSARQSAHEKGDYLVSVAFNRGPPEADGSFLLRVTSLIESSRGVRHREVRDAVVHPRGPGEPYDIRWLGPPRLEKPRRF